MTAIQEKIAAAVGRTRRLWAIGMALATLWVLFNLPLWLAIFLVPLGVITYLGSITLTILWLTTALNAAGINDDDEEEDHVKLKALHDDLESGKVLPGSKEMFDRMREAGMSRVVPIGQFSDEIVGYFNGQTMYEWVEVFNQKTQVFDKFNYYGPGKADADGNPQLPEEDGIVFASVNGIIYAKSKT